MKYPIEGTIKKKYVTISYIEDKVEKARDIEYSKAIEEANNNILILGEKPISVEVVMDSPTLDKEEKIIILATRINYNANTTVSNQFSIHGTKQDMRNDGSTHINIPQLLYEIVEEDGSPRLCHPSEIKFNVESLNKQL